MSLERALRETSGGQRRLTYNETGAKCACTCPCPLPSLSYSDKCAPCLQGNHQREEASL